MIFIDETHIYIHTHTYIYMYVCKVSPYNELFIMYGDIP